jgi:hypothetical protein
VIVYFKIDRHLFKVDTREYSPFHLSFPYRAIYDARLVQTPPVYGVQKGALSVSTAPFTALAASTSQHTYQILVPSLNVFVDRKIAWESGVYLQAQVYPTLACDPLDGAFQKGSEYLPSNSVIGTAPNFGGSAPIDLVLQADCHTEPYRRTLPANSFPGASGVPSFPAVGGEYYEFVQPGANFNLCPFPLQSLCNSMTCSINDCSVTTNGDTLQEQILLTNTRDTQRIRTTPSKFDEYGWTQDDFVSNNGNMSTLSCQRPAVGEIPTGAWPITFYNPVNGTRLQDDANGFGVYVDPGSGAPVYYMNGRPILIPGGILRGQAVSSASGSVAVTPDSAGASTGTLSITLVGLSTNALAAFCSGQTIMITGNTGSAAIWNGYYVVQTATPVSTSSITLVVRWGKVLSGGAFKARNTAALSVGFAVTSDRFGPANNYGTNFAGASFSGETPVNYVSKLLGQIMADGTQIMPSPMNAYATVAFRYDVSEPIIMSPFIYQDALEFNNVGLYGCTSIQFTMNIQAPSPNCDVVSQLAWPSAIAPYNVAKTNVDYPQGGCVIRSTAATGAFAQVQLKAPVGIPTTTGPFWNPRMLVQFLTPGPDISLPLISNVPYMEFPRYTNTFQVQNPRDSAPLLSSQTITLSSIPDFIMVYVKARTRSQLQNETYVPIQNVAVTFDNFSNLCSNMSQQELYTCSVATGLDMDWHTWRGYTNGCTTGPQQLGGCIASGLTGSNQFALYGALTSLTVSGSGPYTYVMTYLAQTPQAIPVGSQISVTNATTSAANGANTVTASTINGLTGTVTWSQATGSAGTTAQSAGQLIGIPVAVGPLASYVPLVNQASSALGGSSVPFQLSTTVADLWPASSGLYNVAGQNKFTPRPNTQLTGGPLLLRMGQDVSLSPGLAPGTLGNFSIQLNLRLDNSQGFFNAYSSYNLTIIAVNSGYFETVRGQSAVRKTILNMADVESASVSSGVTTSQLRRLVGGMRGHSLSAHGHFHHKGGKHEGDMGHKRARMAGSGL